MWMLPLSSTAVISAPLSIRYSTSSALLTRLLLSRAALRIGVLLRSSRPGALKKKCDKKLYTLFYHSTNTQTHTVQWPLGWSIPFFVLVNPYSIPFYCSNKGMDRPEQNRVWINQDVLNCSHCTSRLGFTFIASLCSTWQLSEIGPAQHLNRLFIFLHISWWGARANVSSARAVPTALLWCSISSGNVFGLQISAVTFYFSRARNFFAIIL